MDDGTMRSFETGATRDTAEGKLDMEGFTHPMVEKQFAKFMSMHRLQSNGELRAPDNWQKGIPQDAYAKSLRRHHDEFWAGHRGFPSENGIIADLCGILFNARGYLLEELKKRNFNLVDFDGDEAIPEIKARKESLDKEDTCDGECNGCSSCFEEAQVGSWEDSLYREEEYQLAERDELKESMMAEEEIYDGGAEYFQGDGRHHK